MAIIKPSPEDEQARDPSPHSSRKPPRHALVPQAPLVAKPKSTRRNALVVVIVAIAGLETSAGTHITVPHAWVSNGGLGQSHEDYLHGDTSGLTWWVTILYSEDNCFEAYPYHLASA
jgi:hypothetical protein